MFPVGNVVVPKQYQRDIQFTDIEHQQWETIKTSCNTGIFSTIYSPLKLSGELHTSPVLPLSGSPL